MYICTVNKAYNTYKLPLTPSKYLPQYEIIVISIIDLDDCQVQVYR